MLSTGTSAVPSACLRCQLRQVIIRTGRRVSATRANYPQWGSSRSFSASRTRRHNTEDQAVDSSGNGNEKPKLSEYPLGRISGQPGRRHRETSARLSQDALHKPFDVVVLRDVPDSREDRVPTTDMQETNSVDASQIAREVLPKGVTTNDAEIYESIDALQPTTTIVDDEQYWKLAKALNDGYNTRQLTQYLAQTLQQTTIEGTTDGEEYKDETSGAHKKDIQKAPWKPGKTLLKQRHNATGVVKRGDVPGSKPKVVEQILRRSWSLFINEEMQLIGELEMVLEPWQLSFLFDLYERSRPMYETIINSPLLRRSSELRPDRADNVLRIIARKQDAEEIAERIENNLRKLVSLDVDMGILLAPRTRQARTTPFATLFETSLQDIQDRLHCIIERKARDTLVIHAGSELTVHHARRALLSLVDLPSPTSVDSKIINTLASTDTSTTLQPQLVIEHADLGSKAQPLNMNFGRLTEPAILGPALRVHEDVATARPKIRSETLQIEHARYLTNRLLHTNPPEPAYFNDPATGDTIWKLEEPLSHQSWEVQFCKFLYEATNISDLKHLDSASFQPNKDRNSPQSLSIPSTVKSQIPGIADLLSYFLPKSGTVQSPVLVAHFMPSPFTKNGSLSLAKLPRIRLVYRIWDYPDRRSRRVLHLQSVQATFHEQELRVHLSQEVTDLRIMRRSVLRSSFDTRDGPYDPELQRFTRTVQRSLDRERATLHGDPTINIRLPSEPFADVADSLVQDLRESNFEVEYLFQGFESVQSLDFVPIKTANSSDETSPLMKHIADKMPEYMFLRYEEIDGGTIGGKRVRLKLQYPSAFWAAGVKLLDFDAHALPSDKVRIGSRWETQQKYMKLMETSLRLANALTRINKGELGSSADLAQHDPSAYYASATPELNDVLGQ